MRQKRAKQYRKQMQVLRTTFKFKTPIQCLVDDSTVLEAVDTSYDLVKGVNSVVQTDTKFFITQCCIQHLYDSNNQLAVDLAKRMEKRRCGHKDTLSSFECIKSITNVDGENKYRYLIVTQDGRLRNSLRNVAGVPLCFLHRSVLIMEPLSKVTQRVVAAVEKMKLTEGLNNVNAGKKLNDTDNETKNDDGKEEIHAQKKRKVKGVNPLAMKKKQKKTQPTQQNSGSATIKDSDGEKKRRKRRHGKSNKDEDNINEHEKVIEISNTVEKTIHEETLKTEEKAIADQPVLE